MTRDKYFASVKIKGFNVLIRVKYRNNAYDMVSADRLDDLIDSNKVEKFLRSDGWVTVGNDPIRVKGDNYYGFERRKNIIEIDID